MAVNLGIEIIHHCLVKWFDVMVTADDCFAGDCERRRLNALLKVDGTMPIDCLKIADPKNTVFTATTVAYNERVVALLPGNDVQMNLAGIANASMLNVPLILLIVIPSASSQISSSEPDVNVLEYTNKIATSVCKATFEIPSAETMLQIMISSIVVSRSKADPGPVAVIVQDTAFKSRTSVLRSLLDPLYNPDLELMEACMNASLPGPPPKSAHSALPTWSKNTTWIDGFSSAQVYAIVCEEAWYNLHKEYISNSAQRHKKLFLVHSRKTGSMSAIPLAIGLGLMAKRKGCSSAIVLFVAIESLMENAFELTTAVSMKVPLVICCVRNNNACPQINVGIAGSVPELGKFIGGKHAGLSKISLSTDTNRYLREAVQLETVFLLESSKAFSDEMVDAIPLATHTLSFPRARQRGLDVMAQSLVQCQCQVVLFYEFCRNPTVFQSVGQEMKMAFESYDITCTDLDDVQTLFAVASGVSAYSPNRLVIVVVPAGCHDSPQLYASLQRCLPGHPFVILGLRDEDGEDMMAISFQSKDFGSGNDHHGALGSLLCKGVLEIYEGRVMATKISKAAAYAKSKPSGAVILNVHINTVLSEHDEYDDAMDTSNVDLVGKNFGFPLAYDPDVSVTNIETIVSAISTGLSATGITKSKCHLPGEAISFAFGASLSSEVSSMSFAILHAYNFCRSANTLFSAIKKQSRLVCIVLNIRGDGQSLRKRGMCPETSVRSASYIYGAEHIFVNNIIQLQGTIKSLARKTLGPVVLEATDIVGGIFLDHNFCSNIDFTKKTLVPQRTHFPILPFKFELPYAVLSRKFDTEKRMHDTVCDLQYELKQLQRKFENLQLELEEQKRMQQRKDSIFKKAIHDLVRDHDSEVEFLRRKKQEKKERKQLAQRQKKYIRAKLFKYGDEDEDEEDKGEGNYYCDRSSFSHDKSDEKMFFHDLAAAEST